MTLGKYIRDARGELSQSQFAKALNVTSFYISVLENDRREPSTALLKRIATLTGYTLIIRLEIT